MEQTLNSIIKEIAEKEVNTGLYLLQATGKILEEDKTFIQIMYNGRVRYAKPLMPFGWFNVPTEEWLEKYKDEIGIWVMFEQGNPNYPVWCGIAPLNNKIPEDENYPNIAKFKTVEFEFLADDKKKELKLKNFDDTGLILNENTVSLLHESKIGIEIDKDKVDLGKTGAKEPITLGDQTATLLGKILDAMAQITVVSPVGNTSPPINAPQILALKGELEKIKSKSVNSS